MTNENKIRPFNTADDVQLTINICWVLSGLGITIPTLKLALFVSLPIYAVTND
jgi:hypothetical protein